MLRRMLRSYARRVGAGDPADLADIVPEIGRVVLLKQGRIAGDGSPESLLTTAALSSLYDRTVTVTHRDGHFHAW